MASRKTRRDRSGASPPARVRRWCERRIAGLGHAAASRLRPWRPAVEADAGGKRGRRLRRVVARVTRSHPRGLGVTPPAHLLVVVQRTVTTEGAPAPGAAAGLRGRGGAHAARPLHRALGGWSPGSDEDVVATLRQQLQQVVAANLGTARLVRWRRWPPRLWPERRLQPGAVAARRPDVRRSQDPLLGKRHHASTRLASHS